MVVKTAKEKFKATGSGKAYWWPVDIMTDRIRYVDFLITIQ